MSSSASRPHVAVVGSGPAGFYTAQQILKGHPTACVDIYEKLPVPFGLVRFGVAPDHPEVKNVINTFTQTASSNRCHYLGNVEVGRDVSIAQMREAYSAVILAYGSDDDKKLDIPGEEIKGVHSARGFVGWYNGLPQHQDLSPDLDTDTAVVLGQGNVAIDVARILLTPVDILKKTDITESALEALTKSRLERVMLVGRRGPLQVAFTTAELREMIKLEGCKPVLSQSDFNLPEDQVKALPRARRRLTELLMKTASEDQVERRSSCHKEWILKFLRSPLEVLSAPGEDRVTGIKLGLNQLQGDTSAKQTAVATGESEDVPCGLVFRSIGYKSVPIDSDVPFDQQRAVIPNIKGRVQGAPDLYCSGWVKRGPVGVIVSTMTDAFETGKSVVTDIKNTDNHKKTGKEAILKALASKGVNSVSFEDWCLIDAEEERRGRLLGKPREKVVVVEDMMSIVKRGKVL